MADGASTMSTTARSSGVSIFERTVTNNPPILSSLLAQLPTESILHLYHTSYFLQQFLRHSPTSWRYISWRLHQPVTTQTQGNSPNASPTRQVSSYALDKLLMYVIVPWSTRLTSLVLDNTAVSGATLFQTVMVSRKDTLEHVSVRGCKNVSLKYHINPWLAMHAMALELPQEGRPPHLQKLALQSLYAYRCRHHRRRPYLPSSLSRKESDSEPTHELVITCHKLGIWTDTAWCTTPAGRCYRRRSYVTARSALDTREVWVVFDRLWRSRNWLGPSPSTNTASTNSRPRKRKRDGRAWEQDEEAINGEPIGTKGEGKEIPTHMRASHRQFVDNIICSDCSVPITERCEQCSVLMHCMGCRKTLCASCAFDRPYTRNRNMTHETKERYWWAPGSAFSPCSMQDIDPAAPGAPNQPTGMPELQLKWCCTEPAFSGGGGITVPSVSPREVDRIRAVPLQVDHGHHDPEFCHDGRHDHVGWSPLSRASGAGPGHRWSSLEEMFQYGSQYGSYDSHDSIPRILCSDCHVSDPWKMKCKACGIALCLKHDVKEKQRVRICGYKELAVEKQQLNDKIRATKLLKMAWQRRKQRKAKLETERQEQLNRTMEGLKMSSADDSLPKDSSIPEPASQLSTLGKPARQRVQLTPVSTPQQIFTRSTNTTENALDIPDRPLSPGSNSTGPLSRTSSPAPSTRSITATPEPYATTRNGGSTPLPSSNWRGCQGFYCPSHRATNDQRPRCSAVMQRCTDCKVFVCEDCITDLDDSCQCRGCRLPEGLAGSIQGGTAAFYCPNCRHNRILTRKCRRKLTVLTKKPQLCKEHRCTEKAERKQGRKMSPLEKEHHTADIMDNRSLFRDQSDALDSTSALGEFYTSLDHELHNYQEIGESAVQVVRKVQNLRMQAVPGSAAALALPNIIIEGDEPGLQNEV